MRLSSLVFLALIVPGCAAQPERDQFLENRKPGDVVLEGVQERKQGYVEVFRSIVNSPSHWEGIGHFEFVYYGTHRICQCSLDEVVISPKGRYLVFVAPDGPLNVFDSKELISHKLTEEYVGYPKSVVWQFLNAPLKISVIDLDTEVETMIEVNVKLDPEA